jgi:hypothetical protein
MLRTVSLSIIRSFFFTVHTAMVYIIQVCWQLASRIRLELSSSLILLASCQHTCMTYTIAVCTVKKTSDDGQRNCPKHVVFHSKNKFEKSVHLVGFIIRNLQNILKRLRCVVKFLVYAVCWQKFPIVLLKAYEMIKRKFITYVGIFGTACIDTSMKICVITLVSW